MEVSSCLTRKRHGDLIGWARVMERGKCKNGMCSNMDWDGRWGNEMK
jgi:hypothetical protein